VGRGACQRRMLRRAEIGRIADRVRMDAQCEERYKAAQPLVPPVRRRKHDPA